MSVQTSIVFLNENDPKFQEAKNGTPKQRDEWEGWNGPIEDRPGKEIEDFSDDAVTETEDEYGGWIISIKDIPKDCTHVVVYRG